MLVQFALMGSASSRPDFTFNHPRSAALDRRGVHQGTPLVKETHELLRQHDRIDFYGNVEGRDLLPFAR